MQVRCPNCQKPAEWSGNAYRPFCSEACKFRDLGSWATEEYRVPMHEAPDEMPRIDPADPAAGKRPVNEDDE